MLMQSFNNLIKVANGQSVGTALQLVVTNFLNINTSVAVLVTLSVSLALIARTAGRSFAPLASAAATVLG